MAEVKYIHGGCLTAVVLAALALSCGMCGASHDIQTQARRQQRYEEAEYAAAVGRVSLVLAGACAAGVVALLGAFHVPLGAVAVTSGGGSFGPGWKWHPLARLLGLELFGTQSRNFNLRPFPVRSRDQAEFDLAVAINWRLDPTNVRTFVEQGGDGVVQETLSNIVINRLTQWAYSAGPADWRDALGAHDLTREALVRELAHEPGGVALVPAPAALLVPGEVAAYAYRPLGIIVGGVFIKSIAPRPGSRFGVRDLMLEVGFNLPFERQLEQAVKDIEDLDKLERERTRMLNQFPERAEEVNRKFLLLKTILFDK